ncbi:MAG: DNA-directed RNA polymerase subunit D [Caldisphaeraceae archaeon]|nr:DNA-directed RNA polymerase subunit D [Caldisphaeraceae archaeon]
MKEDVEVLELNGSRITLLLEGFHIAFGNAIRRLVLSDVPTMAVDYVYFYDNTTNTYDEIIAHRLGLLTLKSDEAIHKYKPPEECKDKDETNTECFVQVYLEKSVEEELNGLYIKASDLKFSDEAIEPVYLDTPIAFMAPGQRIHLVGYARLGRGKEHGKWSPASVSILQYMPLVDVKGDVASEECLKCVSSYKEVSEAIKSKETKTIEYKKNINTSGLRYCEESVCNDAIKVRYDKSRLLLTVESNGSLGPQQIILEASKILDKRVEKLLEALEEMGEDNE